MLVRVSGVIKLRVEAELEVEVHGTAQLTRILLAFANGANDSLSGSVKGVKTLSCLDMKSGNAIMGIDLEEFRGQGGEMVIDTIR